MIMMRKYLALIGSLLSFQAVHAEIKFTHECEIEVVKLIDNTQQKIDVAVYGINNKNIVQALENAKTRGVQIRILTDRLQATGSSSSVQTLHSEGFNIKVHSHDRIMHHKFAIFDGKKAIEGSFNWTNSAATKNAEDCNIFDIKEDIETLGKRFSKLWILNKKDISECYIGNIGASEKQKVKCS